MASPRVEADGPRPQRHRTGRARRIAHRRPGCGGELRLATKWRLTGEAQIDCLGHADEAIRRAGFDLTGPGSQSIMGRRGDYTAAVRCVTEQRLVFFAVSGPSPGEVNRLLDAIYNVF